MVQVIKELAFNRWPVLSRTKLKGSEYLAFAGLQGFVGAYTKSKLLSIYFLQIIKSAHVLSVAVHPHNWRHHESILVLKWKTTWTTVMWSLYEIIHIWTGRIRLLLSNCLNWKTNCDDHSSLSWTTVLLLSVNGPCSFAFLYLYYSGTDNRAIAPFSEALTEMSTEHTCWKIIREDEWAKYLTSKTAVVVCGVKQQQIRKT